MPKSKKKEAPPSSPIAQQVKKLDKNTKKLDLSRYLRLFWRAFHNGTNNFRYSRALDDIPVDVFALKKLVWLSCNYNNISKVPAMISKLQKIETLLMQVIFDRSCYQRDLSALLFHPSVTSCRSSLRRSDCSSH